MIHIHTKTTTYREPDHSITKTVHFVTLQNGEKFKSNLQKRTLRRSLPDVTLIETSEEKFIRVNSINEVFCD